MLYSSPLVCQRLHSMSYISFANPDGTYDFNDFNFLFGWPLYSWFLGKKDL